MKAACVRAKHTNFLLTHAPEVSLGLCFPNVLGSGTGGTHVPRAVLQLADEVLEVTDANWSRTVKVTLWQVKHLLHSHNIK